MVEKQQVRKFIMTQRRKMDSDTYREASSLIIKKVVESPVYQEARQILTYVSFGKEVSTRELIEISLEQKKQVLVPKVTGNTMIFVEIHSMEELSAGTMGILEPVKNEEALPLTSSCMIMPGLAFDQKKHRIGYGGGYYDKYLEHYPDLKTIALAFDYQILDQIPSEETDISPQMIITERRVLS